MNKDFANFMNCYPVKINITEEDESEEGPNLDVVYAARRLPDDDEDYDDDAEFTMNVVGNTDDRNLDGEPVGKYFHFNEEDWIFDTIKNSGIYNVSQIRQGEIIKTDRIVVFTSQNPQSVKLSSTGFSGRWYGK